MTGANQKDGIHHIRYWMHNPNLALNMKLDPQGLSAPFKDETNWHVITGAPCSGKTTLIDLLATRGYQTAPEAGRIYIEREIAAGRKLEEIRANDATIAPLINQLQWDIENALQHSDTIFLDRAFPDCLSFFRMVGLDPNEILPECFQHHYASVFVLDRLPYQKDNVRKEGEAASAFLDESLFQDYRALGYDVVRVPVLPPNDRLAFILHRLAL
jgi:predicted ATPase